MTDCNAQESQVSASGQSYDFETCAKQMKMFLSIILVMTILIFIAILYK